MRALPTLTVVPEQAKRPESIGSVLGLRREGERELTDVDAAVARAPATEEPNPDRAVAAAALEPFAVLLGSLGAFEAPAGERGTSLPDRLVAEIVRTIAWGGDRRRGAARLELGGERFAGIKVTIEVEGDRLRLELDAPPGVDAVELRERITTRLERRGLSVEHV